VPQQYAGQETDGKAVGSLILGILAIFPFGFLAGIPAVVLGHLSKSTIAKSMGRLKGEGMATAGLIMGYFSVAFVPLILIVAAVAIPNLLRARMAANESAAPSTVRSVNTAQAAYTTQFPAKGYARDLATLGPGPSGTCPGGQGTQAHACFLDGTVAAARCHAGVWCFKNGYMYLMTAVCDADGTCSDYVILTTPVTPGSTGNRSFCSTADAIVRVGTLRRGPTALSVEECKLWPPVS